MHDESRGPGEGRRCPDCGLQGHIETHLADYEIPHGYPSPIWLEVTVPMLECLACGFTFYDSACDNICDDRVNQYMHAIGDGRSKEWSPLWMDPAKHDQALCGKPSCRLHRDPKAAAAQIKAYFKVNGRTTPAILFTLMQHRGYAPSAIHKALKTFQETA